MAAGHYAEHEGKPFFEDLVTFITRSPVVVMVVEGPEDTYKVVRNLMGATNPVDAAPGTIRGDLAIEMGENLVHGSDSNESATREIELFFPGPGLDPLGVGLPGCPSRTRPVGLQPPPSQQAPFPGARPMAIPGPLNASHRLRFPKH